MPKNEWENDLLDVSAAPSTADDPDNTDPNANPDPAAGNQSGKGDNDPDVRGLDDVRGEFERKFRGLEGRVDRVLSKLDDMHARPAPTAVAPNGGAQNLEDLSVEELRGLYAKAETPEQQVYVSGIIATKEARKIVGESISEYGRQQDARQRRQESMRVAFDRFPELRDKNSTFYQDVMSEMENLGERANAPDALLTTANEAAFRIGLSPAARSQRDTARGSSSTIGGRSTRPAKPVDSELAMPEETFDEISEGLKHAFPNGMSKTMSERIKKRSKAYNAFRNDPNAPFLKG